MARDAGTRYKVPRDPAILCRRRGRDVPCIEKCIELVTQLGPLARFSKIDPIERLAGVVPHKDYLRIYGIISSEGVELLDRCEEIEQHYPILNSMRGGGRARLGA